MIHTDFYISKLIVRYVSKTATESEIVELEKWRSLSPSNEELFQKICSERNLTNEIKVRNSFNPDEGWAKVADKISQKRRIRILSFVRYAAVIALPITVLLFFLTDKKNVSNEVVTGISVESIKVGSGKAALTLADGKTIHLGKSAQTIEAGSRGISIKADSSRVSYRSLNTDEIQPQTVYNTINIPRGGEYRLVLEDGTSVYLNSLSSLKFPVKFAADRRQVELVGEAYFDVRKSKSPFVIKMGDTEIEVLGTSFNLSAYPDENIKAVLVSGAIKVNMANGNNVIMHPSEMADIDAFNSSIKVSKVNTAFYTSWISGKIFFKDESLENITNILSRWYDMDVKYLDEEAKRMRFGCNIDRYKDIDPFFKLLNATGKVNIKVNGKRVEISTNK